MARMTLSQFRLEPEAGGQSAKLHIEDDGGNALELTVTREQLDLLADTLDDFLSDTDEADEV